MIVAQTLTDQDTGDPSQVGPLLDQIDEVQQKLARLEWRASQISDVIERGRRTLLALRDSRRQVRAIGESLNFAAQLARAMILGAGRKNES